MASMCTRGKKCGGKAKGLGKLLNKRRTVDIQADVDVQQVMTRTSS